MRSVLLAVFIGLAVASVDEDAYQSNKHYIYRYEAQLVTGVPQTSQLFSGLKLTANVHLRFLTDTRVSCELTKVNLQKMDKFVAGKTPTFHLQPEERLLDGIEADVINGMVTQLEKHFSFFWVRGDIRQIMFDENEPAWSANIKRGVAGLFQVNLNRLYSLVPLPDKGIEFNPYHPSYTVWEPSTSGYCLTRYTPKPAALADSFYLTKVRDFGSCLQQSPLEYAFNNFRSEQQQNDTKHLDVQAEVTYAMKGKKQKFVILMATGVSKITFVPYLPHDGSVKTSINQTLYLLSVNDLQGPRPSFHNPDKPQTFKGLEMEMPVESLENREPYILFPARSHQPQPLWAVKKLEQLLTLAATGTVKEPSHAVLMTSQTLLDALRQSNHRTLHLLLNDLLAYLPNTQGSVRTKFDLYWQMLTSMATTPAAELVLDTCLERCQNKQHWLYTQCLSAVTSVGVYSPPSELIIKKLVDLLEKSERMGDKMGEMKMVTALSLGAIVGRGEEMMHNIHAKAQQHMDAMKTILAEKTSMDKEPELQQTLNSLNNRMHEISNKHNTIVNNFRQTIQSVLLEKNVEGDVMLALKTLRNAHVPSTIKVIRQYLVNLQRDPAVRVTAAQALEKFCDQESQRQEALSLLEEVVKKPVELAAVRIQAFRSLVNIRAPVETLVRLAGQVRYEEEKQLSTYIWSVFHALSNCTFRPYRMAAGEMRAAIPFVQPVHYGLQDSHYNNKLRPLGHELNLLLETNFINTPEFVTAADVASYLDVFGTTSKSLQLSFVGDGLQKLVKKLSGPNGFFTNRNSLFDLLHRTKRSNNPQGIIDDIFNKLNILTRNIPEPKGFFSMQLKNNVIRTWDFSDFLQKISNLNVIQADIDEKEWRTGVTFDHKSTGLVDQFYKRLPTEAGFPISLDLGVTYSTNVKGTFSAALDTSLYKNTREQRPAAKVKAGLYLEPHVVAAVTGKMAVDGYIFQSGNVFHALMELKNPFSVNASYDFKHNHLTTKFTPPVNSEEPILRLEVQPYVYSRALPANLSMTQAPVNRRPIFQTMQPLIIGNGARVKDVSYSYGADSLGYDITVQGQSMWRASPSSLTCPMLGRSNYAVYVRPGTKMPPYIRADLKYLSQPRYRAPGTHRGACDSWWSWLGLSCYGTSEQEDVPTVNTPIPPLAATFSHFPVLSAHTINFSAVKQRIERRLGHPIPNMKAGSQWAFIATVNTSSPQIVRGATVEGLLQSWNLGQLQHAFFAFWRSPIPNYDSEAWNMAIKTSAFYPLSKLNVMHLLKPDYQVGLHGDSWKLLQRLEGPVTNKWIQQLMFTKVNQLAIQRLPSMDPEIMLDRIMPEFIVVSPNSDARKMYQILRKLLPVSDQLKELKSELKDAFKITLKQDLLFELQEKIIRRQKDILQLIQAMTWTPENQGIIAAVEYTVLKVSQAVFDFRDIGLRAVKLSLVKDAGRMHSAIKATDMLQLRIYTLTSGQLTAMGYTHHAPTVQSIREPVSQEVEFPRYPYDYDSRPPMTAHRPHKERAILDVDHIIKDLKKLTKDQLHTIAAMWDDVVNDRAVRHNITTKLVEMTAANMTELNRLIRCRDFHDLKTMEEVMELLYQATAQHQICVEMLQSARFANNSHHDHRSANNFAHYAFKVQTKELLERGSILQYEKKLTEVCLPGLAQWEKDLMGLLNETDRDLVALQQNRIRVPDNVTPWTTNKRNLVSAAPDTLQPALDLCIVVRDRILAQKAMPHPCLVAKLLTTITTLQQKIAIFKRTLPAQLESDFLMTDYEVLDDNTMAFVLSLTPIFDKYLQGSSLEKPSQTPFSDTALISEGLVEVARIRTEQERVTQQLEEYLFQLDTPTFDTVTRILGNTADKCLTLLDQLQKEAPRVQATMQTTTPLPAYSLYSLYQGALQAQKHIYDILEQQLQLYASHPGLPDIKSQIDHSQQTVADLQKMSDRFPIPTHVPETDPIARDLLSVPTDQHIPAGQFAYSDDTWDSDSMESISEEFDEPEIPLSESIDPEGAKRHPVTSDKSILLHVNTTFGTESLSNYIGTRVLVRKSMDQLFWEMMQYFPTERDACVTRAVKEFIEGRQHLEQCSSVVQHRINSFNNIHVSLNTDMAKMPDIMVEGMRMMVSHMQLYYHDRTVMSKPQPFIPRGKAAFVFEVSELQDSMDQYVMTDDLTMSVLSMPLSATFKAWYPFQNTAPVNVNVAKVYTAHQLPAKCKVDHFNVRTTDGGVYQLPRLSPRHFPPSCQPRTLLAADCSDDKSFAITLAQSHTVPAQKLEIMAEQHLIELIPDYISDVVIVDGEKKDLKFGHPIVLYKKIEYNRDAVVVVISRQKNGVIHMEYPMTGLDIHFDFSYISIEMSSVYKKQLCGLCGNFDGQMSRELEGPRREIYSAANGFVHSYTFPMVSSPQCLAWTPVTPVPVKPREGRHHQWQADSREDNVYV